MTKKIYDDMGFGFMGAMGGQSSATTVSSKTFKRCLDDHPGLKIGEFTVYGGSCSEPRVMDADIYVGLDRSMEIGPKGYPWNGGESFLFYIKDMGIPTDTEEFKKMIDWLVVQIKEGKKVHVGCIGGHGRTGMVLSALVKVMTGEKDAIQYVRKNYCKKAVETSAQIDFLVKVFGVSQAEGTKSYGNPHRYSDMHPDDDVGVWSPSKTTKGSKKQGFKSFNDKGVQKELFDVSPVRVVTDVWGNDKRIASFAKFNI
jgi:hypothetical protein